MSILAIISAAAALGLSVPPQALTADRVTYDSVISCGATWGLSLVRAAEAGDPTTREVAAVQYTAFQALARLYGTGLGLTEAASDDAIRDLVLERLAESDRIGRSESGRRLRDQAHQGAEAACMALAGRIARENAEAD